MGVRYENPQQGADVLISKDRNTITIDLSKTTLDKRDALAGVDLLGLYDSIDEMQRAFEDA